MSIDVKKYGNELFETVKDTVRDIPLVFIIVAVAGIASRIIFPKISPPFICAFFASLTTRWVFTYIKRVDPEFFIEEKLGGLRTVESDYPHLKVVVLIFSCVASYFKKCIGALMGSLTGIYMGLSIEKEHKKPRLIPL